MQAKRATPPKGPKVHPKRMTDEELANTQRLKQAEQILQAMSLAAGQDKFDNLVADEVLQGWQALRIEDDTVFMEPIEDLAERLADQGVPPGEITRRLQQIADAALRRALEYEDWANEIERFIKES